MKCTLLIFASLIAMGTCKFELNEKALQAVTAIRNECFASENMDPAIISRLDDHKLPSRDELKCHSFCVLKKFKAIDEDGIYNMDVFKPIFSESDFSKIDEIFKTCNVDSTDPCVKAYEVHQCFNSVLY
ncbi:PREDICTED: general odorant-binding protein 19d-like [Nicrophorus vespilloides]|uniref:General odorant-binding protein 19d-like n=1 Tax=Nicrophorus vespilloides TaxID=110193 RepID=A0ABM1MMJ7_NICVS|nr:PREDICTED: general odorant-binding protein 19d-like [Nicrophorus vespilloides]